MTPTAPAPAGRLASVVPAGDDAPLVVARDVQMHFPVSRTSLLRSHHEVVHALDGVSLSIWRGETVGLVGETGCGKSTLGRVIAGLYKPTAGHVLFDGVDIATIFGREMRSLRRRFQIVFQDPYLSLNPRMTVGALIGEGLAIHDIGTPKERGARVAELMDVVGLRRDLVSRYPHEFSGGQRQRIAIARALAPNPELIVLDEPVSSLDVSIQAQILRLLVDLQRELGLTYLLIGHDLAVIGNMCHRVGVMYLGRIVEMAERESLYRDPLHPYTRSLFSCGAGTGPEDRRRDPTPDVLVGEVPSPINPPAGCRFASRCPIALDHCRQRIPLREAAAPGRVAGDLVACHRAEEVAAGAFPVLAGSWAGAGTAVGAASLPFDGTPVGGTPAAAACVTTEGSPGSPSTNGSTTTTASRWTLDPAVTFLNHGSFGACPAPILAAQREWQDRLERDPVDFLGRRLEQVIGEARSVVASFVGADPDDLRLRPERHGRDQYRPAVPRLRAGRRGPRQRP